MFILEFPNQWHKEAHEELIQSWQKYEEIPISPSRLFAGKNFLEFLSVITNDINCPPPYVSGHLFYLREDWNPKILWAIQIRHHINHPKLIEVGGHIGYGIRPDERQKWLAKAMLKLALEEAKKLWLQEVLLTCDDANTGSYKTIEANGGKFERYADRDGIKMRRYWIHL